MRLREQNKFYNTTLRNVRYAYINYCNGCKLFNVDYPVGNYIDDELDEYTFLNSYIDGFVSIPNLVDYSYGRVDNTIIKNGNSFGVNFNGTGYIRNSYVYNVSTFRLGSGNLTNLTFEDVSTMTYVDVYHTEVNLTNVYVNKHVNNYYVSFYFSNAYNVYTPYLNQLTLTEDYKSDTTQNNLRTFELNLTVSSDVLHPTSNVTIPLPFSPKSIKVYLNNTETSNYYLSGNYLTVYGIPLSSSTVFVLAQYKFSPVEFTIIRLGIALGFVLMLFSSIFLEFRSVEEFLKVLILLILGILVIGVAFYLFS